MERTRREVLDTLKATVLAHLGRPETGKTLGHLMVACDLVKGDRMRLHEGDYAHTRLLDAALQELRREGKVRFDRPEWKLIPKADSTLTDYQKSLRFTRTSDGKVFRVTFYSHWSDIVADDGEQDSVKFYGVSAKGELYVSASRGFTYTKS